ncbi:MAG: hypothetical protein ACPGUY_07730, partial [Akkermansiaceae bacterium]
TNPYEPPQTKQKPQPRVVEWFERCGKYQWRMFYSGMTMVLVSVIVPLIIDQGFGAEVGNKALSILFITLLSLGAGVMLLSLLLIVPLTIWGFIKGFREGRSSVNAAGGELDKQK